MTRSFKTGEAWDIFARTGDPAAYAAAKKDQDALLRNIFGQRETGPVCGVMVEKAPPLPPPPPLILCGEFLANYGRSDGFSRSRARQLPAELYGASRPRKVIKEKALENSCDVVSEGTDKNAALLAANQVSELGQDARQHLVEGTLPLRTGYDSAEEMGEALANALRTSDADAINEILNNSTPEELQRVAEVAGGGLIDEKIEAIGEVPGDNSDYRDAVRVAIQGQSRELDPSQVEEMAKDLMNAPGFIDDNETSINRILTLSDGSLRDVDEAVRSQGDPRGVAGIVESMFHPGAHRDLLMGRLERIGSGEAAVVVPDPMEDFVGGA